MIVQYIIDWEYVSSEIQSAGSDDRLESIRKRLRSLRKKIEVNGALLIDKCQIGKRSLDSIIKELNPCDATESELPKSWLSLKAELEGYSTLYFIKRIIILDNDSSQKIGIEQMCNAQQEFLRKANLLKYNLPCVVISSEDNRKKIEYPSVHFETLATYEESDAEEVRNEWERLSFTQGDDQKADQFWAGLSLGASAFGKVSFFDPYCLKGIIGSGDRREKEWDASRKKVAAFFTCNEHIHFVTFYGKVNTLVRKPICIEQLEKMIKQINKQRNQDSRKSPLTLGVGAKMIGEGFHDRWIDVGIGICYLPRGLDVYKEAPNGSIEIGESFVSLAIPKQLVEKILGPVESRKIHPYKDMRCCENYKRLPYNEIKPSDSDHHTFEIKFEPSK